MSALAQSLQSKQADNRQVTAISSLARVDYILRFSKHAVVVIDENASEYSAVGSQFLANLSGERNAAYLTVSNKLDDVQIRCRLIEQLFGQVLFDPEQSLAVSMVNLLKQHLQPLTIVVEHAHLLSFQLIHELCQLAEIGRKASLDIQVVMLAQPEVGAKMNQHTLLFHKKLSIISATSGQLIPLSDKSFQSHTSSKRYNVIIKWVMAFAVLVAVAAFVIYQLYQMETFKFSQLTAVNNVAISSKNTEKTLVKEKLSTQANLPIAANRQQALATEKAKPSEIRNALLGLEQTTALEAPESKTSDITPQQAAPVDIVQSLSASFTQTDFSIVETEVVPVASVEQQTQQQMLPEQKTQEKGYINANSPFSAKKGLVIQLSVVSNKNVIEQLKTQLETYGVITYRKRVNDKIMTVFTTPVFDTREQAERFRQTLPEEFATGGAFVKSLGAIKAEISAFERSQSVENQVTIPTS